MAQPLLNFSARAKCILLSRPDRELIWLVFFGAGNAPLCSRIYQTSHKFH